LRLGIPFSTPPDTRYEYSNYGFGLLGRVVARVSGVQYEKYVQTEILAKLGMRDSTYQFSDVPLTKRAIGYRIRPDGTYLEEPPLPQGAFSSAGGLLTTAADLGKYVAFHLSAWPPRDDPETGPVLRSSVREMSHMWTPSNLAAGIVGGKVRATESGYGYGLRVSADCRFGHIVGHGGGLPGFGSYMMWLPDYGVGIFAMANLTYSGPSEPIHRALDAMLKSGGLKRRELPASPMLAKMREHIFHLWQSWDDAEAKGIASMNLFLDAPVTQRRAEIAKLKDEVGECTAAGPVVAENWLRGQFNLRCRKGLVGVFYTLSPTQPPLVQHLAFRKIASDAIRLSAPTGAPAGIACSE
jgi:CubicO group peptidase (beta-lactamase class C family)